MFKKGDVVRYFVNERTDHLGSGYGKIKRAEPVGLNIYRYDMYIDLSLEKVKRHIWDEREFDLASITSDNPDIWFVLICSERKPRNLPHWW